MITIKLNYYNLREQAFKYEQKRLREVQASQDKLIDEYLAGFFLFKKPTRIEAGIHLSKDSRMWQRVQYLAKEATEEYCKIRTACNLSEDGLVEVDADTVYRIFGDTQ
jgi:hypothetical protein